MPSAPRLRSDLTVSRQETADGSFSIVKDSTGGRYYRFREAEQFIVEQLDGTTPLDVVRTRTERRFDATLSAADLQAFVQRLDRAGLLESGAAPSSRKSRGGERGKLRGNLLYLRWPLLDPDALLDRLVHRLPFFFTPRFVATSAAIILVAALTLLGNWGELTQDLGRLYTVSAIPLLVLVLFVVASAHEFAHGLTCKHFGGQVHEMGFLLMYFQPALYTNVSDAWLLPERRQRLWVGLAGPWFELFLWALAVLVWRVTAPDSGVHQLALAVTAVSGVKTLFNFNPLLKLDGYYLLSDYLAIPNLRKRSFAYVGNLIRRLIGSTPVRAAHTTPRERRVFLAYGIVATVMSVGLLLYVTVKAGGFLLEKHEPLAFATFAGLVSLKSRRRFRKLFRTSRPLPQNGANGNGGGGVATAVAEPDDEAADETVAETVAEPPAQPKKKKLKHVAVWTLAAGTLALLVFARLPLRIGGGFMVLPEENADVRAGTEAVIDDILVTEGDRVTAGQVIARLSNHALETELEKSGPLIRETQAFVSKLERGPTAEELALGDAGVARTEDRLRFARSAVERLSTLYATASVTRQELEAAQELAANAENDLAEAKSRLEVLRRRSRPEDIDAARARLASLEAQRRFLENEVKELTAVSPVSGVVATPARQLKEMRHQLVGRGALIAKIYDFSTVMAQIVVAEKDIGEIRVGQAVALRVRAYPDRTFQGTVTAIATAADGIPTPAAQTAVATATAAGSASPGKTFIVTTRIDNRAGLLRPGMTGWAKVSGDSRRLGSLLTRRVARIFRVEVWSWW